jgi:two-component system, cell cycle sensor histidine kinase and response regulator CckA
MEHRPSPTEEPFAKAFRANPGPMVVSDKATGEFLDVNERWIELVGYTREEMIHQTSKELGIWVDWEARSAMIRLYESQGEARDVPAQVLTKSGEIRDVLWSLEFIDLHGREAMLSLLYDVTELRRSQEALRASEERFKRLLQNSNDIVTVLDEKGIELAVHGPVEKVLGYTPEELLGTSGYQHVDQADGERLGKILCEMLQEPGSIRRAEYRHRHKDGSWVVMETVGTNLLHDPVVKGIVLNTRNVTERVRLQEQLQQAMKMEAIGRLAGGIAHDFNNLLTAILGNIELTRMESAVPASMQPCLDEIQRAARSAASLTRQLLSFSRRQMIEPKVLNLSELVTGLRNMLGRLLGEDIKLTMKLADLARVRVDPGQFEQVLVNLAVNARDAMPNGGELCIETANATSCVNPWLDLSSPKLNQVVRLSVRDTGVGMSPEVKSRLFEPFFTTKPNGRGTGLGLATTFGIVKQAGGTIDVESELGTGTTFTICLPHVDDEIDASDSLFSNQMVRGNERILLVEDDAGVRGLTLSVLRQLGYRVVAAADPAEGLLVLKTADQPFDVVLTDVVMPGMNGRQFAEQVLAKHPSTKVLYMSGYTDDMIVHHGVVNGSVDLLSKPFTIEQLAAKLREVLSC